MSAVVGLPDPVVCHSQDDINWVGKTGINVLWKFELQGFWNWKFQGSLMV